MDKLAVITGGSKGIGRALIEKLAAEGFTIATCARSELDLASLQQHLQQQYLDVDYHYQVADVSDPVAVQRFAQWVLDLQIPIAMLVNNAGLFIPGQIHSEEEGILEQMMETNLYSAYHLTRALAPTLMKQKQGHIFNICSIASIMAYPNGGSYAITKFAMLGMSKVLREEMKLHGVRVTSVLPGATLTNSWAESGMPEERLMAAEDVAQLVLAAYQVSERTVVEEILMRPQLGDIT